MTEDRRFPHEKMAKLDNEERRQRQPVEAVVELIASMEPAAVLELGVGTGYFALPLLERLPEARLSGLDASPRMLEVFASRARERGVDGRVEVVEAELRGAGSVPLDGGAFDVVLLVNLYHELDDRRGALADASRLLRPGGRLVLCDWDPKAVGEWGPPQDHRVRSETVEADLASAGLSDLHRHDLYEGFYTYAATRP